MGDHDDYICKTLLADEALHSKLTIWLDFLLIIPLTVAYTLQYRCSLKTSIKQPPKSYVVCAALFALFQLCDYLLDNAYGVLVEAHCWQRKYDDSRAGFDVWVLSWVMGFQCLMATCLMVFYTLRSYRSLPDKEDEEETAGHDPSTGLMERGEVFTANEETPLISQPAAILLSATHRFRQTGSRADLSGFSDWKDIPLSVRHCVVTIIILLISINLILFAQVSLVSPGVALFVAALLVLGALLASECLRVGKKTQPRCHQSSQPEPERRPAETVPLPSSSSTSALTEIPRPGYRISSVNTYADWSFTISSSSLLAYFVLATIAALLLLFVVKPLFDIDHTLVLPLLLLLSILTLLIVAFTLEAQDAEVEHRRNLLCSFLLVSVAIMTLYLYINIMFWETSLWWEPIDADIWVSVFRSVSLVLSWLLFILQFIPLISRVWKRQDTGLSVWSLVIMNTTQIVILASLVERADRRFQVERLWCLDEDASHGCGGFYGYGSHEHVWALPLFWASTTPARMGYAIILLTGISVCAWWRARIQSEETRGEEGNDEERAGSEQEE